jgi:hypothetical protein
MFKAYGEFVRNTGNHPGFRFDRLDQEILELPDAYSTRNGEVLLAMRRSEVVGCIAYRAVPTPPSPRTCEIKRLFVLSEQRAHGIGSSLVSTCKPPARIRVGLSQMRRGLPSRSVRTHLPSHCWMVSISSPASSLRRKAQSTRSATRGRSRACLSGHTPTRPGSAGRST